MHFTIQPDHPALPGHFPGHPVVPGVVILSHIFDLVAQNQPQAISGIRRLKFLQQVLPGQTLRLEIALPLEGRVAFKCWLNDAVAVEGQAALAA